MPLTRRQLAFGSLTLPLFAAKKPERPNILLLLADDLPAWALGCYGNKEIRTPHLDRLAQMGTRFVHHFSAAPAPGAGRASLLTGRAPMQLGESGSIPAAETTIEKLLGAQGYASHTADAAGGAAFLDAQTADKPFCLTVNLPMPAEAAAQKHVERYAAVKFETVGPERASAHARQGREMLADPVASLRKAAAAITALDENAQTVLTKLAQKKLVDSTLVVFTATCGALLSHHGLWGAADASEPANLYEESVATPMIWSWPSRVPPQVTRPELVSSYDLLPALAGLLEIDLPAGNRCGRSYALLATGKPLPKKEPWRTTVFAHFRNADMARVQRYKLIQHPAAPGELYNLITDPGERTNQFDNPQFVSVRTSLEAELSKWKQRYSAP